MNNDGTMAGYHSSVSTSDFAYGISSLDERSEPGFDKDSALNEYWNHSSKQRFDLDDTDIPSTKLSFAKNEDKYEILKSGGLDDEADTTFEEFSSFSSQKPQAPDLQPDHLESAKNTQALAFETVEKIVLNKEFSFVKFKGKDEKVELLKAAVQSHDGNAILTVVLFLRQTLKRSLFQREIGKFPDAVNMYLTHLEEDHETDELINVLLLMGRSEDAAMYKYESLLSVQQPDRKMKMIENCLNTHFQSGMVDRFYIDSLQEHQQLIKEQVALEDHRLAESQSEKETFEIFEQLTARKRLVDSPAMLSLIFCELYFPNVNEIAFISPASTKARFNLSKKQFTWAALRTLAFTRRWNEIEDLFLTKNWLGGSRMKSCIGFQKVVEVLGNMKAPIEIISKYVSHVEDPVNKLNLAKKHLCHSLVLEILKTNKDRKGLAEYRAILPQHSVDYITATDILNTAGIKWKN